jgi:hypothetical protein
MMMLPNLDQIEKYLKKHNKNLSEKEIKGKAEELLNNYMESNKERIEQAKIEDKLLFEEALEKEALHLWIKDKLGEI